MQHTLELFALALSVLLGLVHLSLATVMVTKQRGAKWNLSSREEPMPALTGATGRVQRAFENFKETFPFFVAAIVIVVATGEMGTLSKIGSFTYLIARVIYVFIYGLGITVVRTIVWAIATAGIFAVLADCFI